VVCTAQSTNLSVFDKYASFYLYSAYVNPITFTIGQEQRYAGIDDMHPEQVLVYPVPAADRITIRSLSTIINVSVYDASGRMVPVKNEFSHNMLDLSGFAPGLYYLQIQTREETFFRKIIRL
jgi:hypothetical protein